ncbi:hypothetical protein HNR46_001689 [Haloferula luteola]|uniref:Transposase n=1 Tax=Haloferula luteola TaxID=595692 RepID=A0A840V205_9BACT|nr:hypothetical protein [Haloferula luteola]MBB5351453.1 hypothetical protein [Haloferula luteola]
MKRKRGAQSVEVKAWVVLEARKQLKPGRQIAQDEGIHPVLVSQWKVGLEVRMPEGCASGTAVGDEASKAERDCERLACKIGQLVSERCDELLDLFSVRFG